MGSDDHYREEAPARRVTVEAFSIDPVPVTNASFAQFVAATGYVTVAEIAPVPAEFPGVPPENLVAGSMVFVLTDGPGDLRDHTRWWRWTPGADWRHPTGPNSDIDGLDDHPAVHVALADADAYCAWDGAELPTEAEWEYAARGGLEGAEFTWGEGDRQESDPMANTWQGGFSWENTEVDGWVRTSPVGTFAANGYGLHDMAGNVWEWTADWFDARGEVTVATCCSPENPRGATREASVDPHQPEFPIPRRVVKGGSHLCAPSYCYRYRPAARQPQMIDTGMSHLGFRTVRRT